jgi:hypothetical protein
VCRRVGDDISQKTRAQEATHVGARSNASNASLLHHHRNNEVLGHVVMKVGDMVMRKRGLVKWTHYDEVGIIINIHADGAFLDIEVMWQHVSRDHTDDTLEVVS